MQESLRIFVPELPHEALNKLTFDTRVQRIKKLSAPTIKEVVLGPPFLKGLLAFAVENPWGQDADASAGTFSAKAVAIHARFPRFGGA
jgi:hypothetical protein